MPSAATKAKPHERPGAPLATGRYNSAPIGARLKHGGKLRRIAIEPPKTTLKGADMPTTTHRRAGALAALIVLAGAAGAEAQNLSMMEMRRIAGICRADYETHCPGVRPGGGRILACLNKHESSLSPDCRAALPQAAAAAAQAGAQPAQQEPADR